MPRDLTLVSIRVLAPIDRGPTIFSVVGTLAREVTTNGYVARQLFAREFRAQFRRKIFGFLWIVIGPAVAIAPMLFLDAVGIVRPGDTEIPYPLFALTGATIWSILAGAAVQVGQSLVGQSELILRANISKIAVALSAMGNLVFQQGVGALTVLVAAFALGFAPTPWFALYPVLILPMLCLGLGLGLLLAALNVLARDVSSLVVVALGLGMYLCPVGYKVDFQNPILRRFVELNPLTHLVDFPRQVVFSGSFAGAGSFLYASASAFLFFWFCVFAFYRIEPLIPERL